MKINAGFIFHNVGQGLFYTGEIKLDNIKTFRFIYDCGSSSAENVNRSIMNFKKANEWDGIDLLILSHLHKDHVNGLDKLFNEYEVNQVILPYFSPEERLFIALRNINKQDWYYRFLSDPVEFFIEEKKVEKVIIITGRDEGEGEEDDDNQFDDDFSPEEKEYEETKDKIDLNRMPDDDSNISENGNWGKYKKDGKLLIKNTIAMLLFLVCGYLDFLATKYQKQI
ncbi:MAG: MBL fold metallo-hydrolase [Firmicutes bacterium]|nr:MBL fold metallo-hydrolase [Bacillota bacterium]